MEGTKGLCYFFLLELTKTIFDFYFENELLENDLFLCGVSMFLNLFRYSSLYPLYVLL